MQIPILAVGRNEEIMQTLLRLINKNEQWIGHGALTDDEALKRFDSVQPKIVLLCNGIDESSEKTLSSYFTRSNPAVIIIQHYGGGSGLLTNEILQALDKQQL